MELIQGITAALFVVLGPVGAIALLRRRGLAHFNTGVRGVRRLETLEKLMLTPQHALHLVRVDDRTMVVVSAPGTCQVVGPLETCSDS